MINIYTHPKKLTWADACALPAKLNADKHLGFDDWTLPNVKQLKVLKLSALCESKDEYYWSSSPDVANSDLALGLYFGYGGVNSHYRSNPYYVRLVRASQLADIEQVALERIGMASPTAPAVKYEHPHADLIFQWAELVAKGEVGKGWWEVQAMDPLALATYTTKDPMWIALGMYKIVKTDKHPDNVKVELTISVPVLDLENIAGQLLPHISRLTSVAQAAMTQLIQQAQKKLNEREA